MSKPTTIKEYIAGEDKEVQPRLKQMHALLRKVAPKATEKLAWGMPTLCLEGNLFHFAAFKNHMSLFPGGEVIKHFKKETVNYTTSKGTIQFPYEEKLPVALIARIAKFCVKRNLTEAKAKAAAKKAKTRKK
jgi:uncharacterized protein YdhG (YjbR/CyaY superfamily)